MKWLCKPKLNRLIEEYLKTHKLANNTVKLTRRAWSQMVTQTGDIRVSRFSRDDAESIQSLWQHKSNTTARIYRKSVSPVFSWAVVKGYIKTNPFSKVRTPKASKRQVRVYEPIEFKRLLEACPDMRWIAILLLAKTTGMRKSAIQNLTLNDICFDDELIVVREKPESDRMWRWWSKDRGERKLPLVPAVARVITELVYTNPTNQPYVLLKPSRYYHLLELKQLGLLTDEQRISPISNFDRTFRKIKQRAAVKGRFHDLRSTCLTDLADVLNPNELALIGGHSDVETTMRYIGIGRDVVSKARNKVIESLGAIVTPSHALLPN